MTETPNTPDTPSQPKVKASDVFRNAVILGGIGAVTATVGSMIGLAITGNANQISWIAPTLGALVGVAIPLQAANDKYAIKISRQNMYNFAGAVGALSLFFGALVGIQYNYVKTDTAHLSRDKNCDGIRESGYTLDGYNRVLCPK